MDFLPITAIQDEDVVAELSKATGGRFAVTDEASAVWVLLRIVEKKAALAAFDAQTLAMREDMVKNLAQFESWSEPQLEHFTAQQLEAGGNKVKTLETRGGNLSFRTVAESWSVPNTEAGLAAAATYCPSAITTKEVLILDKKLLVEKAKAHMETTGEVLDGIERKPARESFSITLPTKAKDKEGAEK